MTPSQPHTRAVSTLAHSVGRVAQKPAELAPQSLFGK